MKEELDLKGRALKNGSYKVVALFISLVLWVTILGRSGLVQTHTMEVEYLLGKNQKISNNVVKRVKVEVMGPEARLKKFAQIKGGIIIHLETLDFGDHKLKIKKQNVLKVPVGVRVVSIKPSTLKVRIQRIDPRNEEVK